MPSSRAALVAILFAAWSIPCPADAEPGAKRDQPPELKLKLGHYSNTRRGIGLVFDRSTAQAKVRFDGSPAIIKLDRQHGGGDRIDYIRSIGHVVLQQWDSGRVVVFIAGADDGIEVRRDGDADPL
jgi:hypothetical protein